MPSNPDRVNIRADWPEIAFIGDEQDDDTFNYEDLEDSDDDRNDEVR